MPKEEWGTKRLCPQCQTKFYDLQNDPMTCPACGAQMTVESLASGRGKVLTPEKASSRAAAQDDSTDDDTDDLDDDDSNDLDDDLLEDDDDDGDVSLDDIADVSDDDED